MTIQKGERLPDVPITVAASDGPKPTTTGPFPLSRPMRSSTPTNKPPVDSTVGPAPPARRGASDRSCGSCSTPGAATPTTTSWSR